MANSVRVTWQYIDNSTSVTIAERRQIATARTTQHGGKKDESSDVSFVICKHPTTTALNDSVEAHWLPTWVYIKEWPGLKHETNRSKSQNKLFHFWMDQGRSHTDNTITRYQYTPLSQFCNHYPHLTSAIHQNTISHFWKPAISRPFSCIQRRKQFKLEFSALYCERVFCRDENMTAREAQWMRDNLIGEHPNHLTKIWRVHRYVRHVTCRVQ